MFLFGGRPGIRLWKNHVGVAKHGDRTIRYGLPGSTDLIGIRAGGQFLAIEVKTGTGRLSPQQINFRDMILKQGGLYVEARCVEDVERALAVAS